MYKKRLNSLIYLIILAIALFGCKSTEEIQRQEMFDQMAVALENNNRLTSEISNRVQYIESQLQQITGKVEQTEHENKELVKQNVDKITSDLSALSEKLKQSDDQLSKTRAQVNQQNKFIKKITTTISQASDGKKGSLYDQAMLDYKKGRYKTAQAKFATLLGNKNIRGNKRARVLHNLGIIHFMAKRHDDSLVYLSKVITKFGKCPYVKNALLFIGKNFSSLKKPKEAKAAFQQLIKKYPKSKQAKQAKKLL